MSEELGERPPAPVLDLFATAVHRFGAAWADLVAATLASLALMSLPVLAVHQWAGSSGATFLAGEMCFVIAYFLVTAFVVLRGLPARPSRGRVLRSAVAAVVTGVAVGAAVLVLQPVAVVVIPLALFSVPAVAAGDAGIGKGLLQSPLMALGHFTRTWGVWLLSLVFSIPIWISVSLVVLSFTGGVTQFLVTLAVAAPIIWPFSALFVRALYGDLSGRLVVAPQDRSR